MAKTIFHSIKFKNFLSVGNAGLEYRLDSNNHTLVTGQNGHGKSLLMDALTYGLFNKPFRDINLPNLINSINGKELVVEIEFTTNNVPYKIIRGMKPNIFEIWCNGELLNQESRNRDYQTILEKQILKMNYKTFTQVVIIGAANFTVFMKLTSNARRDIVDDFLDTRILTEMNKVLKNNITETKNLLSSVSTDITVKSETIKVKQGYVDRLEKDKSSRIAQIELELAKHLEEENIITDDIVELEKDMDKLTIDTGKIDSLQETITKLNMFEKRFKQSIKDCTTKIKYYEEITHCPQCEQDICDEHKTIMITKNQTTMDSQEAELIDLTEKIKSFKGKLEVVKDKQNKLSAITKLITAKNAELRMIANQKSQLIRERDSLTKSHANLDDEKDSLRKIAGETITLLKEKEALTHERNKQDIAAHLLKDQGIKTSIVRKYLPTLNSLINKYCAELDFFVLFEFDENFEETIKSRHRDKFSYGSFSEGQKKRIDFAIVFAWRELIRQKNSIDTNLLILDEVFDGSLDQEGTALFNNIIFGNMMKDYNVFLISHWPEWSDTFPNHIQIEMKNNFTVFKE